MLCSFALVVLLCVHVALLLAFGLAPPTRLLGHYGLPHPGKYRYILIYSPLRIQYNRYREVTHGRLPWLPP